MNFLTHYGRFNLFLILSGGGYFYLLQNTHYKLAEALLLIFLVLLIVDFEIFVGSSLIYQYSEQDPLIVSLSGMLIFYFFCLVLQSAALRDWLMTKKIFWPDFIIILILWLFFYFIALWIIHKVKADYQKNLTKQNIPEN